MSAPTDPLAFSFGLDFKSAGDRAIGEKAERRHLSDRLIPYHVPFLDDYLRGILPHDLTLLGADTGVGKTDLAATIARKTAATGRTVHYFALEAEPNEIERRTKYGIIAQWAADRRLPFLSQLNYVDWYLGRCDGIIGSLDRDADVEMRAKYKTLHTYYKGAQFGADDIKRLILAVQTVSDLIVIDHLHYVDIDDDNENRGLRTLIKTIRDTALGCGRPVLLVVHLRKGEGARREPLVPSMERVHGSSDIAKMATNAIMLSRAPFRGREWWFSPTFISIPKFRMGGACRLVAMSNYDIRTRAYEPDYTLGQLEDFGVNWTEVEPDKRPPWAARYLFRNGLATAPPAPSRGGHR